MSAAGFVDYQHVYEAAPVSEDNPFGGDRSHLLVTVAGSEVAQLRAAFPEYLWVAR